MVSLYVGSIIFVKRMSGQFGFLIFEDYALLDKVAKVLYLDRGLEIHWRELSREPAKEY